MNVLSTYEQDADALIGQAITFAAALSSSQPLGTDTLESAVWSVVSGTGTVSGSAIVGAVASALFRAGAIGTKTVFKCVATTTKGQTLIGYLAVVGV